MDDVHDDDDDAVCHCYEIAHLGIVKKFPKKAMCLRLSTTKSKLQNIKFVVFCFGMRDLLLFFYSRMLIFG